MHPANSPQTRIHMRGLARVGLVIAVAALCFIAWNIISAHRAAAKLASATEDAAIVTVNTTHPKPTDPTGSELVLPGTVQADIDAPIYARTSGYLKRWLVDIGTRVKAGQLLAEIDTPEVQQQLSQAEADEATAEAMPRSPASPRSAGNRCARPTRYRARTRMKKPASPMPARRSCRPPMPTCTGCVTCRASSASWRPSMA